MKLKDKVAIITGSSRGIGKATALLFAKEGAKVVVDYHVSHFEPDAEENAQEVVAQIKEAGGEAVAIKGDVSDEKQVEQLFKEAIETYGKVDILINNAGIVYDAPFTEKTVEQWKETLNTNLIGAFICSKYFAKATKHGKIVNISSTSGIKVFCPETMDYDASKAGMTVAAEDMAKELAPNILVNTIAPGWVNTDMNKDLPEDFIKAETEKIYLKRFAEPEEIAKTILFLASDDANYITGSTLRVDGGYD